MVNIFFMKKMNVFIVLVISFVILLVMWLSIGATGFVKKKNFMIENLEISYHYRQNLLGILDRPIYRTMNIKNTITNKSSSIHLEVEPVGINELRFYKSVQNTVNDKINVPILLLEDGFDNYIININTLETIRGFDFFGNPITPRTINTSDTICLGKFYQDVFHTQNCIIESY